MFTLPSIGVESLGVTMESTDPTFVTCRITNKMFPVISRRKIRRVYNIKRKYESRLGACARLGPSSTYDNGSIALTINS